MLKRHNIDKMHMLNQQDRQNMKSNQASYMMHTHFVHFTAYPQFINTYQIRKY